MRGISANGGNQSWASKGIKEALFAKTVTRYCSAFSSSHNPYYIDALSLLFEALSIRLRFASSTSTCIYVPITDPSSKTSADNVARLVRDFRRGFIIVLKITNS